MKYFESIESALEYVRLLGETTDETIAEIAEDIREAKSAGADRKLAALNLITYKLEQLRGHMTASQRLLKDLRTLRRLLLGERRQPSLFSSPPKAVNEGRPMS